MISSADGCSFILDGQRTLDFGSQTAYMNVGHHNEYVVAAIKRQLDCLPVGWSRFANEPRARLAKRLSDLAPGGSYKAFFTPGGAEAIEAAIMAAREVTGRRKILTHYWSFHGATTGAIATSGDDRGWHPLSDASSVVRVQPPYPYRCRWCKDGCTDSCIEILEDAVRCEGPEQIAAVLVEPIHGTSGVIVPPDDYLPSLRELTRKYGILLIADEVMTGFGRTGTWFACEHWNVVPDIIALAKGLTAGYVPMGAALLSEEVAGYYDERHWRRGHTYSGHALAAAAALAVIEVIERDGLVARSRELGQYLLSRCQDVASRRLMVGDVRGRGLFVGIELVRNRETKAPLYDWVTGEGLDDKQVVVEAILKQGVYVLPGNASSLVLAPPLCISREELDLGIAAIDEALQACEANGIGAESALSASVVS